MKYDGGASDQFSRVPSRSRVSAIEIHSLFERGRCFVNDSASEDKCRSSECIVDHPCCLAEASISLGLMVMRRPTPGRWFRYEDEIDEIGRI